MIIRGYIDCKKFEALEIGEIGFSFKDCYPDDRIRMKDVLNNYVEYRMKGRDWFEAASEGNR